MKNFFMKALLILDILAFAVYAILTQLLIRVDVSTGTVYDGLGRQHFPAPMWLSTIYTDSWVGMKGFITDTILSFGLIIIAYLLYKAINKEQKEKRWNNKEKEPVLKSMNQQLSLFDEME